MLAIERQATIIELLAKRGALGIPDAAKALRVSEATVRRDFEELHELGRARRVRGGIARAADGAAAAAGSFNERVHILAAEKNRIGRAAARLVNEGETIIMDGGTTTSSMAPYLVRKRIQVITNSITVADYLADAAQIEVIVVGGYFYRPSKVLLGAPAVQLLRDVNASTTFVSAGGLTLDGIGHSNSLIIETEQTMIARGRKVVLLADHSKFGMGGALKVCPWTNVDTVITDRPAPAAFARFFRTQGIKVIVA